MFILLYPRQAYFSKVIGKIVRMFWLFLRIGRLLKSYSKYKSCPIVHYHKYILPFILNNRNPRFTSLYCNIFILKIKKNTEYEITQLKQGAS